MRRVLVGLLGFLLLGLVACSPEATRTRGSGPGADVGNHGTVVQLHGTPNPYYLTPVDPTVSREDR